MGDDSVQAWLARVLALGRLAPEHEAAFERERVALNRMHVRGAMLALLPIHLAAMIYYWPSAGLGTAPAKFGATVCVLQLIALPLGLAFAWLAARVESRWAPFGWTTWACDLFAITYVLYGAGLSVNAQRLNGNLNVYTIVMLGLAVLLRQRGPSAIATVVIGATVLVIGLWQVQPDAQLRYAATLPGVALAAISLVMSRVNVGAARSELTARMTIEAQRSELAAKQDELEALNQRLEQRVVEQGDELEARNRELAALDQQVQTQVRERSRQISQALKGMPRATTPLATGTVLDERVEIRTRIASGAMGDVYRGHDRILGREVAVKVLRADSGVSTDVWARFAGEAQAAAAIRHPAVVKTLHVGVSDDGRMYQLQELVDGVSLADTVADGGRWSAAFAARIGAHIAEALAAAHAAGVVHRDVKPSNVMLTTATPAVHLLDFGVSKLLGDRPDTVQHTAVVGTPPYMAPEQFAAPDSVAAPCDVYALGVLMHELITGAPPFSGNTAALLHAHLHDAPPRLPDPLAPAALADLIAGCLAKDPAARPGAWVLAIALAAIADAGDAPPAHRLPRPTGDRQGAATVELNADRSA